MQVTKSKKNILITGGAGFIGSHVVRRFVQNYPEYQIVNVDVLTYAGNLENIKDIENEPNYSFEKVDICDAKAVFELFANYQPDGVIHLAAESHVDRSISSPLDFVMTNVIGTVNLLNAAKHIWDGALTNKRFHHVSTDEVYGTLGKNGFFTEETSYDPHSPYSASKASSDHFVRAYADTYGLPVVITNCSNNYGPNHFPEKLIPLCSKNIDLVRELCKQMDEKLGRKPGTSATLITFVKDRPGHDLRYAIDATKIKTELGWEPSVTFEEGLAITIDWYLSNEEWLNNVTSGAYQKYYDKQYK